MQRPDPIPLRPDATSTRRAHMASLHRAVWASAKAAIEGSGHAADKLRESYPDDRDALALVTKGAVSPLKLSQLPSTIMVDFVAALAPTSAAAALLQRGLQLQFDRHAQISVPAIAVDPDKVAFVAEGEPIPVQALAGAASVSFAVETDRPQ